MQNEEGEEDTLSGFEPDLPTTSSSESTNHIRDRSFDSIFDETNSRGNEDDDSTLNLIRGGPHSSFNPDGTNNVYTTMLIVNAALGAGLLNFPKAFDAAGGVAVAIIVQAVLLVFIMAALVILAHSADSNCAATIQDAMGQTTGRIGRLLTSLAVVLYCFGTTVTFLIMIGDQYDRIFASLVGPEFCHTWYMNRDFTMTATGIVCILPFCFSKRIDFLRIPSLLGVLAIFYLVALIAYEYWSGHFVPGPIKHVPTRWTDVFLVVPDICFGYQCHVSVIPIYSCMKHRNLKSFTIVVSVAVAICAVCYTGAAAFGYLTFGSYVNEDILMSYSAKRTEVLLGIVAMALKTVSTYPILLFCGREAFSSVVRDATDIVKQQQQTNAEGPLPTNANHGLRTRVGVGLVWFVASLVFAVAIPNIGDVIELLGSLAAVFIFIFPGLCLFQVTFRSDPSLHRTKNAIRMSASFLFMFLGAFIFGVVFTQAIQQLAEPQSSNQVPICSAS